MEAVQPSGKIQPLGLDPWIRHGLEDINVHEITIDNVFTSIVKQCPGIMIPGSSLPELMVQRSNLIDSSTHDDAISMANGETPRRSHDP